MHPPQRSTALATRGNAVGSRFGLEAFGTPLQRLGILLGTVSLRVAKCWRGKSSFVAAESTHPLGFVGVRNGMFSIISTAGCGLNSHWKRPAAGIAGNPRAARLPSPLFHKTRLPKEFATPIPLPFSRRAVIQHVRTLEWGSRGREFESSNRIFGKCQPVRGLRGAIFTYSLTIRESLPECCLHSPQYRLFLKCAVAVTLRKAAKFGAKTTQILDAVQSEPSGRCSHFLLPALTCHPQPVHRQLAN